jgi:hypothetical protein
LSRLQGDVYRDVFDTKAVACEERQLGAQVLKLQPAEEVGVGPNARELRRGAGGCLDDSSEASLDVPLRVVPGAMGAPVLDEPLDQLGARRPCPLSQERT